MTTTARQATAHIATNTAALAELVILAAFTAFVADLDVEEFEFDCQMCGNGCHEIYTRMTEDFDEVEACETCINTYCLGYAAE